MAIQNKRTIRNNTQVSQVYTDATGNTITLAPGGSAIVDVLDDPSILTQDFKLSVLQGLIEGNSYVEKFGDNDDMALNTEEDIWSQGGTYTYLTTASTLYASSGNAGDTQEIVVIGLDANWLEQTKTVTLEGQSQVAIPGTWMRVYRAYNNGSTVLSGDIYIAEQDNLTDGVPDTATKIKAKINTNAQQTLMALYTVPDNKKGYLLSWYASIQKKNAASVDINIKTRYYGKTFLLKDTIGIQSTGASAFKFNYDFGLYLPPKTDIKITGVSDTAAAQVSAGFTLWLVNQS